VTRRAWSERSLQAKPRGNSAGLAQIHPAVRWCFGPQGDLAVGDSSARAKGSAGNLGARSAQGGEPPSSAGLNRRKGTLSGS
jgi:hypothetical protein